MTVVYLGVFQIGLAYVCLGGAIRRLPALEVSLLLLLEPVLNPVWTWLIRGEAAVDKALRIKGHEHALQHDGDLVDVEDRSCPELRCLPGYDGSPSGTGERYVISG